MPPARLLSVDPSLTCSGWALFELEGERLIAVGKVRSMPPAEPLAVRLKDLQEKIRGIYRSIEFGLGDVLICEAPTTMRDPGAAFKVEQVRCIFEAMARDLQVQVPGRLNPRSVHHEIMGLRGRQQKRVIVKDAAVTLVHTLFGDALSRIGFDPRVENLRKHQDIVDALLLGHLGSVKIRGADRAGVSLEEVFHNTKYASQRRLAS